LVAFSDVLLLLLNSNTPRADAAEAEFDAAANPIQSMNSDVASPEAGSLPSMSLPVGASSRRLIPIALIRDYRACEVSSSHASSSPGNWTLVQ
jgi:hypothetical protein